MENPIVILDPMVERPPGRCDVAGCSEKARYAYKNLYVCADCLITACVDGFVTPEEVVYRVPEFQKGS